MEEAFDSAAGIIKTEVVGDPDCVQWEERNACCQMREIIAVKTEVVEPQILIPSSADYNTVSSNVSEYHYNQSSGSNDNSSGLTVNKKNSYPTITGVYSSDVFRRNAVLQGKSTTLNSEECVTPEISSNIISDPQYSGILPSDGFLMGHGTAESTWDDCRIKTEPLDDDTESETSYVSEVPYTGLHADVVQTEKNPATGFSSSALLGSIKTEPVEQHEEGNANDLEQTNAGVLVESRSVGVGCDIDTCENLNEDDNDGMFEVQISEGGQQSGGQEQQGEPEHLPDDHSSALETDNLHSAPSVSFKISTALITSRKFYVCFVCGTRCGRKKDLHFHMKSEHSEVTTASLIEQHCQGDKKEQPYECKFCSKRFARMSGLNHHNRIHLGERPFPCGQCEKSFSHANSLKSHMMSHTGEKPFPCEECGKSFRSSSHLKRHKVTHTGEKPFSCTICQQKFTQAVSLKSHMSTHTGEKPIPCHICNKTFANMGNLKSHLGTHMEDKPFVCKECNKGFSKAITLKTHMLTHTGERPYKCDLCGKAFFQASNLKGHMYTHTGEKPFLCTICHKGFPLFDNLRRHLTTHIGEMPVSSEQDYTQISPIYNLSGSNSGAQPGQSLTHSVPLSP